MRTHLTALLCLLATVSTAYAAPQKSTDNRRSDDTNAVWYNARHGDADAMNKLGVWYYSGNNVDKDYSQAYYWWQQGAVRQNAKAIANLGICYQYGRGVESDSVQAIRLYLTAIENGQHELFEQRKSNVPTSTFDDMLIGLCYEKGIGTSRNLKTAADVYAIAADKGSTDAMLAAGRAYMESGDAAAALKYLDKAAVKGDNTARYLAGKLLINNKSADIAKAVKYITDAADSGNADAKALLGTMYQTGNGVSADSKQAMTLMHAAAEGGSAEGMWLYGNALLADKSYDEALFWLSMAAQAGRQDEFTALMRRLPQNDGFVHYVNGMKAYLIDGDYAAAITQFQSVGKSKSNEGKVMEMVVLSDKKNTKGNAAKASKELSKIADSSPMAANVLAELYLNGNGVDRDTNKAISLYRQAANAGNASAQDALATIYYDGTITSVDRQGAAALYEKAYRQRRLSAVGSHRLQSLIDGGKSQADISNYNASDPVIPTLKAL